MNLLVENPIVLGRIDYTRGPAKLCIIDTSDNNNLDNPSYDIFGQVIVSRDDYYLFGEHVVHIENLERYFEDYLQAERRTKK